MIRSPETLLYLKENLHTGHLQHVSSELTKWVLEVLDFYKDRVSRVARIAGHHSAGHAIQEALHPDRLKERVKRRWIDREIQVSALLLAIKVMRDPHFVDLKLSEVSTPIPPFEDAYEALKFLDLAFCRSEDLLQDKFQRLGTLKTTGSVYAESRLLKRAIFDKVYMTPPRFV